MLTGAKIFDSAERRVSVFVAGSGAITQFHNRVFNIVEFFMVVGFIVISMAAGTGLRIWKLPIDYLCIGGVAVCAFEWIIVFTRIARRDVCKRIR